MSTRPLPSVSQAGFMAGSILTMGKGNAPRSASMQVAVAVLQAITAAFMPKSAIAETLFSARKAMSV